MRLTFDTYLDGPAYPGPLGATDAFFGEGWVGPLGLLGILETQLGLGGLGTSSLQRSIALRAKLAGRTGFWRESFEVDPLATCRRLLRDRDLLALWGWQLEPVSPRLAQLAQATAGALPGLPDRLRAVSNALQTQQVAITQIDTYTRRDQLVPLWRRVFDELERAGVSISEQTMATGKAVGDLSRAREENFVPEGDGRLCLLRRYGPLEVADEIAAALAALDDLDRVVIIGADGVLNDALGRLGLPTASVDSGTASGQLLSLVIEATFQPIEIADLHALIVMNPGPVPCAVARWLMRALCDTPGRGSKEWAAALAKGLESIEDESRREQTRARLTALLNPVCKRDDEVPLDTLRERLVLLQSWVQRRAVHVPTLMQAFYQVRDFVEALDGLSAKALSRYQLQRLCADLGPCTYSRRRAQVGLTHVRTPGAILAPARTVIWWDFSRARAIPTDRMMLVPADAQGLRTASIEPPDSALQMSAQADTWRRPLLAAEEALILACPETDEAGESNHMHPWWDELTASLLDFRDSAHLQSATVTLPRKASTTEVELRPSVIGHRELTISAALKPREVESPSSIEKLLGCSLAWTLQYLAGLSVGLSAAPPTPGPVLSGSITHRVLAQVLTVESSDPERAAALAGDLFDQQVGTYEALELPSHQVERSTARRTAVDAARALVRLVKKHGATVAGTEMSGELRFGKQVIRGRMDLILENPDLVLDLKWGKTAYRDKLKSGTQVQLAMYAAMRSGDGEFPEAGYFSLLAQRVLAEPGGRLKSDGEVPGAATAEDVWQGTQRSLTLALHALAQGQLEAAGVGEEAPAVALDDTGVHLGPPCAYCEFDQLCARAGGK